MGLFQISERYRSFPKYISLKRLDIALHTDTNIIQADFVKKQQQTNTQKTVKLNYFYPMHVLGMGPHRYFCSASYTLRPTANLKALSAW